MFELFVRGEKPATVRIGSLDFDACCLDAPIPKGQTVKVLEVQNGKLLVGL